VGCGCEGGCVRVGGCEGVGVWMWVWVRVRVRVRV